MGIKKIHIGKGAVGANATAPATSTSALLAVGKSIEGNLKFNVVYSVTSLKQAEIDLGITADYDLDVGVVLHQHIADFYSFKGNKNAKLYIMVVDIADEVNTPANLFEDTNGQFAKFLLKEGAGGIKQLAFSFNVPDGYTETLVNGMNAQIYAAIPKAELLYKWADEQGFPCNIFLEGRGMSDTMSAWQDLRNIVVSGVVVEAEHVTIVAGQDYDYAETRLGLIKKYGAVGKALGATALAEVNQSAGEVGINSANSPFNLSDAIKGTWLTPGLSNHKTTLEADIYMQDIDAKGYMMAYQETGVTGLRFNGDPTCTPIKVDEEGKINPHTVYYGRTLDYAAAMLKAHLLPLLRARVNVNPKTGKLPTAVIKNIEAEADTKVFGKMVNTGLCSGGKTFINPESPVMPPDNKVLASFELLPTSILGEIQGTIYLTKTINS